MTTALKFVRQHNEAGDTASFFFRAEAPFCFNQGSTSD
jgi:hypothetical protein